MRCPYNVRMRFLRVLFITLLCAVLPISGMAATGVVMDCPIPSALQMAMATEAMDNTQAMNDCMQAMDESAPSQAHSERSHIGKNVHCKLVVQCQVSSQYIPIPSSGVDTPIAQSRKLVFHYARSLSATALNDLWRPPQAV